MADPADLVQLPRDVLLRLEILHRRYAAYMVGGTAPSTIAILLPTLESDGRAITEALGVRTQYAYPPTPINWASNAVPGVETAQPG